MQRRRDRSRHIWLVVLGAAVALVVAGTVNAAAPQVVSLRLVGSAVKRTVACPGERHPDAHAYTLFRRNARITITGTVTPKPSARPWSIEIKMKRCARGVNFHKIWARIVTGRPDGSYVTVYTVRLPGYYVVSGRYGGQHTVKSNKQRFVVR